MPISTTVETISCMHCADMVPLSDAVTISNDYLCHACADDNTTICHNCGDRIWNDDDCGDGHISLCEHCRENHYTRCTICDALLSEEYAHYEEDDPDHYDPYCWDCYQELEDKYIHKYSYKPMPIFHGKSKAENTRYFGLELEVDGAGKNDNNAKAVLDILNAKGELGYIKADGSLDDGMELVLHPMTFDFIQKKVPWEKVLDTLRAQGYQSHKTKTAGLHVHINRVSLGKTEADQDKTIANLLYFHERFWEEILTLSRRSELQVRRWAARYGYQNNAKDILDFAKRLPVGRYTAVNLCNCDTVEFRIFRGTLKQNTIIATLQFLEKICSVAISLSETDLKALSWPEFVQMIDPKQMPELVQYLKERMLYVNEPVTPGTSNEEE